MKLTDESLMPWGVHKGKTMIDVPPNYLLFLWDTDTSHGAVKEYIIDNLDVLKSQVKR